MPLSVAYFVLFFQVQILLQWLPTFGSETHKSPRVIPIGPWVQGFRELAKFCSTSCFTSPRFFLSFLLLLLWWIKCEFLYNFLEFKITCYPSTNVTYKYDCYLMWVWEFVWFRKESPYSTPIFLCHTNERCK